MALWQRQSSDSAHALVIMSHLVFEVQLLVTRAVG